MILDLLYHKKTTFTCIQVMSQSTKVPLYFVMSLVYKQKLICCGVCLYNMVYFKPFSYIINLYLIWIGPIFVDFEHVFWLEGWGSQERSFVGRAARQRNLLGLELCPAGRTTGLVPLASSSMQPLPPYLPTNQTTKKAQPSYPSESNGTSREWMLPWVSWNSKMEGGLGECGPPTCLSSAQDPNFINNWAINTQSKGW
jgi:hypothetical protein